MNDSRLANLGVGFLAEAGGKPFFLVRGDQGTESAGCCARAGRQFGFALRSLGGIKHQVGQAALGVGIGDIAQGLRDGRAVSWSARATARAGSAAVRPATSGPLRSVAIRARMVTLREHSQRVPHRSEAGGRPLSCFLRDSASVGVTIKRTPG